MTIKNVYFIIGFLLWSNNSFGMEQVPSLIIKKEAGLFDLLPEDTTNQLFASLQPNQINLLRKSCKKLKELFSFHNPSLEFILCKNPHINQRDIESLFIVSVYDRRHAIVEALLKGEKICNDYFYKIPTISSGLFPYCIAEINKDNPMVQILKDFNHEGQVWKEDKGISFYIPNPMLIACISRNSDRVEESIKKIKKINEIESSLWLHILIANKDNRSLCAVFQNIQISDDMKKMGNQLIKHACDCCNSIAVEILLNHGCYDDFNKTIVCSALCKVSEENGTVRLGRYLKQKTLLDDMEYDQNCLEAKTTYSYESEHKQAQSRIKIYHLLREKGAKTADELIQEKNKKETEEKCCIQ